MNAHVAPLTRVMRQIVIISTLVLDTLTVQRRYDTRIRRHAAVTTATGPRTLSHKLWLQLRFYFDSTAIRPRYDHSTTTLRSTSCGVPVLRP